MVDVARVDVRARVEQQVSGRPRSGEVQRRLSIASSFVHARRIGGEHRLDEVEPIQMRRGLTYAIRTERPARSAVLVIAWPMRCGSPIGSPTVSATVPTRRYVTTVRPSGPNQ